MRILFLLVTTWSLCGQPRPTLALPVHAAAATAPKVQHDGTPEGHFWHTCREHVVSFWTDPTTTHHWMDAQGYTSLVTTLSQGAAITGTATRAASFPRLHLRLVAAFYEMACAKGRPCVGKGATIPLTDTTRSSLHGARKSYHRIRVPEFCQETVRLLGRMQLLPHNHKNNNDNDDNVVVVTPSRLVLGNGTTNTCSVQRV